MPPEPIVVVVGGSAIDYTIRASWLPTKGRSATGDRFLRGCGGKGFNQAIAIARLGVRAALVSCVGDDHAGDEILAALAEERVDASAVVQMAGALTPRTLINVDARGDKQTAWFPGASRAFTGQHLARQQLSRAAVVVAQLEFPIEAVLDAARMARAAGVTFVLDAAPAKQVPDALLALADVATMNGEEAAAMAGFDVHDRESAMKAARSIQARGARRVCIGTADGRATLDGGEERWLVNHPVEAIDTTGAGDACAAGIAVALAERKSFRDACDLGHAAAALAITVLGARDSLPRRESVEALLRARALQ